MSAALSRPQVDAVAALAHLELSDAERELFARQLGEILHYVEQLQAIDTSGVPPTASVFAEVTDRADEPAPSLPRADALLNAPDANLDAGLFKVPRVIG
ncbi:MAG: Asp-tRNA(Asn)/Glu-tRNA(Gln) amidotransferase subunit GatC [Acidobacteriaceae bacterium]|jgi:aspartyl-tRNA(Asn)/glutamyl-tRNA(Gln) amidotransferase subunit C|nr:Asp-tRNA(Asn)/Glu-tRNA(Gln) amidotransferase subunit GatC [Acidobacteriaceae bacterium]